MARHSFNELPSQAIADSAYSVLRKRAVQIAGAMGGVRQVVDKLVVKAS